MFVVTSLKFDLTAKDAKCAKDVENLQSSYTWHLGGWKHNFQGVPGEVALLATISTSSF